MISAMARGWSRAWVARAGATAGAALAFGMLPAACTTTSPAAHDAPVATTTCGDGVVQPGETSETCCAETGCTEGVCDPTSNRCVDPWVIDCAGVEAGECAKVKPYVCADDAPPAYDCGKCGCPDGQVCADGVCYASDVPGLRRDGRGLSTELPIDDYFRFLDELTAQPALTFAELVTELTKRMHADSRRAMLSLGESHNSSDEQAVGLSLVREIVGNGFSAKTIGVEGGDTPILDASPLADLGIEPDALDGDLTNDAYCAAATKAVGKSLVTDRLYVQYTGSGHTSQEACFHPEHYSICRPPHTAECVAKIGRKALTVMLFDPDPWLTMTDNTLLWRVGAKLPDEAAFDAELRATLDSWAAHFKKHVIDPKYAAHVGDRDVNVRFVASPRVADVFIAFFPRPTREPFLLKTFNAVWNEPSLRAYFLTNGMNTKNCSVSWDSTPGAETYSIDCNKDGKELSASLDREFEITSSSTN
jgi:hypothetical protein